MFIHQPLKGRMQRTVKTKSDLFINDTVRVPFEGVRTRPPGIMAAVSEEVYLPLGRH